MCHTRTVLPAVGAAGRLFFSVVLSGCWLCSRCFHGSAKHRQNTDRMLPVVRAHDLHIHFGFASKRYVREVTGIGDADVAETRFCLKYAQGQKSLKGLPRATYCTDGDQTSGNVSPTVELCPPHLTFRIKVRARTYVSQKRKKKTTIIRIHILLYIKVPQ